MAKKFGNINYKILLLKGSCYYYLELNNESVRVSKSYNHIGDLVLNLKSLNNKDLDELAITLSKEILVNYKQRIKNFTIKQNELTLLVKFIRKNSKGYKNINTCVGGLYFTGVNIIHINIYLYNEHRKSRSLKYELLRVIRHELDHMYQDLNDSLFFNNYFCTNSNSKFTACKNYYLQKQEMCANIAGYKLEAQARKVLTKNIIKKEIKNFFYSNKAYNGNVFKEHLSETSFKKEVNLIIKEYIRNL